MPADVLTGKDGRGLRAKLEEGVGKVSFSMLKDFNGNLQTTFKVNSKEHGKLRLQVSKYISRLQKATALNYKCFCGIDNDENSKQFDACCHEFHKNCLYDYMTCNLDHPDFECPSCSQNAETAVK